MPRHTRTARLPMLIGLGLAAATSVPAQTGGAQFACTFERECVSDAACGAASFNLTLSPGAEAPGYRISTLTGETAMIALDDPATLPASFAAAGTSGTGLAELLTVEADGSALFSVHIYDGTAQAVTYFGSCEVSR